MKTKTLIFRAKKNFSGNWENYSFILTIAGLGFSLVYSLIKLVQIAL